MIKNLYILGLGLLLGIAATATISFATTPPKMPAYPAELTYPDEMNQPLPSGDPESGMQNSLRNQQKQYDSEMKAYNSISSVYNYNINIVRVGIAAAFLILAGVLFGRVQLLPEAFAAGGLMVLLGLSSSTFVSFWSFDTSSAADTTFRVSVQQLGSLYAATIIAGAVGFWAFRNQKISRS